MVSSLVLDGFLLGAKLGLVAPQLDPKALPGTLDNFEVKLSLAKRARKAYSPGFEASCGKFDV